MLLGFLTWKKQQFVDQIDFVLFQVFEFEFLEFAVFRHKEIQEPEGFTEGGIHVILDTIVSPAWKMLGNSGPSIAKEVMEAKKGFFILFCPEVIFSDRGIELITPSKKQWYGEIPLSALFAWPIGTDMIEI